MINYCKPFMFYWRINGDIDPGETIINTSNIILVRDTVREGVSKVLEITHPEVKEPETSFWYVVCGHSNVWLREDVLLNTYQN